MIMLHYTGWARSRYTVIIIFLQVLWMVAGNLSIEQREWIINLNDKLTNVIIWEEPSIVYYILYTVYLHWPTLCIDWKDTHDMNNIKFVIFYVWNLRKQFPNFITFSSGCNSCREFGWSWICISERTQMWWQWCCSFLHPFQIYTDMNLYQSPN